MGESMKALLVRLWERRFLLAALCLLAFVVGLSALTFRLSWDITEVDRERSLRTAPVPEGAEATKLDFRTSDGTKLGGLWIPVPESRGTVVLCHGRGSGKGWFLRHGHVEFLYQQSYSCLAFDFQATGESGGRHCTLGDLERSALHAAIAEARRLSSEPIALWGVSMGAATAILVSAEATAIPLVIAESSYDSFIDTTAHHQRLNYKLPRWPMTQLACWLTEVRTGCDVQNVDMVRAAAERKGGLLLQVHCEDDIRTPTSVARRIFDTAAQPKEFFVIPGVGHGKAFEEGGKRYRERVRAALQEHLGGKREGTRAKND